MAPSWPCDPHDDGPHQHSTVLGFYSGKTVFVIGASGFIGSCILHKLLSDCFAVQRVFVLLRPQSGVSAETRFQTLLPDGCSAESKAKVHLCPGDLNEDDLGLTTKDLRDILQQTDVIINCAAAMNFRASFRENFSTNVLGPWRVLELAKRCAKSALVLHYSTAFVVCSRPIGSLTKEDVMPEFDGVGDPHAVLSLMEGLSPRQIERRAKRWKGTCPNFYIYSKLLGERMIAAQKGHVPVAIVRPSIVMNSLREPTPGFIRNPSGILLVFMLAALGRLPVIQTMSSTEYVVDLIPVDHVVNIGLAAAWDLAARRGALRFYHASSSTINPLRLQSLLEHGVDCARRNPAPRCFFPPEVRMVQRSATFYLMLFARALALFCAAVASRKHPLRLSVKMTAKLVTTSVMVNVFYFRFTNEWFCDAFNTRTMWDALPDSDRAVLPFDVEALNWKEFVQIAYDGVLQYTSAKAHGGAKDA